MDNVDKIFKGFGWGLVVLGALSIFSSIERFADLAQGKSVTATGIDAIILAVASPVLTGVGGWMVGRNQK